jgi:hypothetical protein
MNAAFTKYHGLIAQCLICFACTSYAQMRTISTSEFIHESDMIIVGKVQNEAILRTPPGTPPDGRVITVSVNRILKSQGSLDTLDIITFKGDRCGGTHLPPILLYARKMYLFFLDTAFVPSTLITKYNLQGRTFFAPYFCGTGVVELKNQRSIDKLREIEDSLSIAPPTPVTIIPLAGWIDSLSITIDQALSNGLIGDSAFVDTLHGVLSNARNLLLLGDSTNCAVQLVRFDKMIHGAFGGFDRLRFVRGGMFTMLSSDVLYLHSSLPGIPYGYESLPLVSGLSPNSIRAGEPGFTLTLNGEQFEDGATVNWNWSPRPTTFLSSTELQATITSEDIASPDTVTVAIVNPGGGTHGAWFVVRRSYTLTVTTVGNGTVTMNPEQPTYDSASTVQLTAVPSSACYGFLGWSGDTSGAANPITVTMNGNKAITATFQTDLDLAMENKSCSPDATATNNARHLARSEYHLHEVFISGGEIFYRRSGDGGSNWDQTHQLNTSYGENSLPCIATTQNGPLQIVWQRKIAPLLYEVWHSYSTDGGESWSTPAILPDADQVQVSQYQTEGAMPVIAERVQNSLLVVYCTSDGLRYRLSEDGGASWSVPNPDLLSSDNDNTRVQYPSLSSNGSDVFLLYDYGEDGYSPFSRIFDGSSWSNETSVGKGTVAAGIAASVAIDAEKNPVAAWSADHVWSRSIVFRAGYSDNTWSTWFVEFWGGQLSPDRLNPAITYYNHNSQYGIAIVHHRADNTTGLIHYDGSQWDVSTLSQSGAWAGITQEDASSGTPIYCWTEQGSIPYTIVVGTSEDFSALKRTGTHTSLLWKRKAVVYHRTLKAMLSLEVEPLKVVLANGDTTVLSFKKSPTLSRRQRGKITFTTMWEYLGSDTVALPATARRLVVSKQFTTRGASLGQRKFTLGMFTPNGTLLTVVDTASISGTISVNIAQYAGRQVILRPQVTLGGMTAESVEIGVGDVFTARDEPLPPQGPKRKSR